MPLPIRSALAEHNSVEGGWLGFDAIAATRLLQSFCWRRWPATWGIPAKFRGNLWLKDFTTSHRALSAGFFVSRRFIERRPCSITPKTTCCFPTSRPSQCVAGARGRARDKSSCRWATRARRGESRTPPPRPLSSVAAKITGRGFGTGDLAQIRICRGPESAPPPGFPGDYAPFATGSVLALRNNLNRLSTMRRVLVKVWSFNIEIDRCRPSAYRDGRKGRLQCILMVVARRVLYFEESFQSGKTLIMRTSDKTFMSVGRRLFVAIIQLTLLKQR